MLAVKLLSKQFKQTVKPNKCRALLHTDLQIPAGPAAIRIAAILTRSIKITTSSISPHRRCLNQKNMTTDSSTNISRQQSPPSSRPPILANIYFKKFPNYCQMITDAKKIAKRSILIDHCGVDYIDLETEFDNIERVYHIQKETKRGYSKLSLIEFKSEEDAERVSKQARHNEGLLPVPLKVFRYTGNKAPPPDKQQLDFPVEFVNLSYTRETNSKFDSYTELMCNTMMSLIALKLRFITLVNFERILCSGMFEEYELLPFGSSVIDLGCDSGDLDLVVQRKEDYQYAFADQSKNRSSILTDYSSHSVSRLVHLDKSLYSEVADKSGIRGTMRWFDHILREYMPLTDGYGVIFVRHARVPIIKFNARITNIDCDLSFNLGLDNRERLATHSPNTLMAQILYFLCRNNNIFPVISTYLKIYARLTNITTKELNSGLKNFQYLSLIMFYLQQVEIPRPSHQSKVIEPCHNDGNHSDTIGEEVNRKSLKDDTLASAYEEESKPSENVKIVPPFSKMLNPSFKSENLSYSSEEIDGILNNLITGFFEFYSKFDFSTKSLNLLDGKEERKLDNSSMYVKNPLDRNHNICHNVNRKALDTLVKEHRQALGGMRQGYHYNCPLTLIKHLMTQGSQKEMEKSRRKLKFSSDGTHLDSHRPQQQQQQGTTFPTMSIKGVAQDVCS